MKTTALIKVSLLVLLAVAAAGCIGQPVKFSQAGAEKLDLGKGRPVMAQSCGFQLLLLIPINVNGRGQKAYDWLVKKAGPETVVTDIKVMESWFYGFVGTGYCTRMEGTAYPILASLPDAGAPAP